MLRPARSALAGVTLALATTGLGRVMADKGRATSPPPVLSVATEAPDLGGLTEPVPIPDPPPSPGPPTVTMRVRVAAVAGEETYLLACIRAWETGGGVMGRANYASEGYHRGAYQMYPPLWARYFGDRQPAEVTPEEQDAAAAEVLRSDGGVIQPWRWPTPSRRC